LDPSQSGDIRQRTVAEGRLGERRPEEIVILCRSLDARGDEHLLGELLGHLSALAVRYLTPRANPNLSNRGKDAVDHVWRAMQEAILDPDSADGAGYGVAFYPKLNQRLVDEIRRQNKHRDRQQPFVLDEEGEDIEPADNLNLGPEEHAILSSILQQLPENQRKAFLLRRGGYDYYSQRADLATIASTLKISDKTARKWVAEAENLIRQELGATR